MLSLGEKSIHIGVVLECGANIYRYASGGVIHKVIHIGVVDKSLTSVDNYVTQK